MHSGVILLSVICAIFYLADAKPTFDKLTEQAQTTAQSTAESASQTSTRSLQNGISSEGFSKTQSSASSSVSQSNTNYKQMFQFIREQEICTEQDFNQLLQKLQTLVDKQYVDSLNKLKEWHNIESLANREEECKMRLSTTKEELIRVIIEAGKEAQSSMQGCQNGDEESFKIQLRELRQKFESQIKESLIYFIEALKTINESNFQDDNDRETRCIGKKKKLAARSIGSGIINAGVGMIDKAVDTGKGMMNSGIEMGGEMVNSVSDFKTGMRKKATDFGGDMIKKASSTAGSVAESGVEFGSEMFNSARGIGEGMVGTASEVAGDFGSKGGHKGPGKDRNCNHGSKGGKGPHHNGQHSQPKKGSSEGYGYEGYQQGQEGGNGISVSTSQASSSASGAVQQFDNAGDGYNGASASARSHATAETNSLTI